MSEWGIRVVEAKRERRDTHTHTCARAYLFVGALVVGVENDLGVRDCGLGDGGKLLELGDALLLLRSLVLALLFAQASPGHLFNIGMAIFVVVRGADEIVEFAILGVKRGRRGCSSGFLGPRFRRKFVHGCWNVETLVVEVMRRGGRRLGFGCDIKIVVALHGVFNDRSIEGRSGLSRDAKRGRVERTVGVLFVVLRDEELWVHEADAGGVGGGDRGERAVGRRGGDNGRACYHYYYYYVRTYLFDLARRSLDPLFWYDEL